MKSIIYDLRRALTGRWFFIALAASAASLYISIGYQSYQLASMLSEPDVYAAHFQLNAAELVQHGMQGEFGVMILPALSALPFAAQALQEIKSGAIRPAVFRVGRRSWVIGKLLGALASAMLLQMASALVLLLALHLLVLLFTGVPFPMGDLQAIWPFLLRRMLSGGVWALAGCLAALVTDTSSAAHLAPLCLCYAMAMIGSRFFPGAAWLNPVHWLHGTLWPLLLLMAMLAAALSLIMGRKVNVHV